MNPISMIPATALVAVLAVSPASAQNVAKRIDAFFEKADADRDGALTLKEWLAAGRKERGFRKIDADTDGKVIRAEIEAAARARLGG